MPVCCQRSCDESELAWRYGSRNSHAGQLGEQCFGGSRGAARSSAGRAQLSHPSPPSHLSHLQHLPHIPQLTGLSHLAAAARVPHCSRSRAGVTLLELLVVLVLISISAALVVPALRFPSGSLVTSEGNSANATRVTGLIPTPEVDGVLANARRIALQRGEPVRIRVASDGAWAIAGLNGGAAIQTGRVTQQLSWQPDLTVDAMGTCVLSANAVPLAGARAWDALACRWREATP